jgi:hypothetical protein
MTTTPLAVTLIECSMPIRFQSMAASARRKNAHCAVRHRGNNSVPGVGLCSARPPQRMGIRIFLMGNVKVSHARAIYVGLCTVVRIVVTSATRDGSEALR